MEAMNVDGSSEHPQLADSLPQGYDDSVEGQDPELDYEGYMTKSQLYTIGERALALHDMIEDGENLPEWMQSKVAQIEQMIGSVYNALDYDKARGTEDEHGYQEE